jgi:hypothetical protein
MQALLPGSHLDCHVKPENESKLSEIMQIYLPIFALFFSKQIQIYANQRSIYLLLFGL